jgi:hypothetical protein
LRDELQLLRRGGPGVVDAHRVGGGPIEISHSWTLDRHPQRGGDDFELALSLNFQIGVGASRHDVVNAPRFSSSQHQIEASGLAGFERTHLELKRRASFVDDPCRNAFQQHHSRGVAAAGVRYFDFN